MIAFELPNEGRDEDQIADTAQTCDQDIAPRFVLDGLKRDRTLKPVDELNGELIGSTDVLNHIIVGTTENIFDAALDQNLLSVGLILFGQRKDHIAADNLIDQKHFVIHESIERALSETIGMSFARGDETVERQVEIVEAFGKRRAVIPNAENKNPIVIGKKFFNGVLCHASSL